MNKLFKSIGLIAFYIMAIGLLVYAGSRSLDFIQSTLPDNQKLIGFLGLLATEGGAIIWLVIFLKQAGGTPQKTIAALIAVVDMCGSIGLFTIDTLYRSGQTGQITTLSQDDIRNVILMLSGLIGLNLIAVFFFHIVEPENMRKMREDAAKDAVQDALLKHIEDNAEEITVEMLPALYAQWSADFKNMYSDIGAFGLGHFHNKPIPPLAVDPEQGFVKKAADTTTIPALSKTPDWMVKALAEAGAFDQRKPETDMPSMGDDTFLDD